MIKFPTAVQDFASHFVTMQTKRHDADYDPYVQLAKSEVESDIRIVRQVIEAFLAQPVKDRRAFATYVILKRRD
jgi:hypothetical protein